MKTIKTLLISSVALTVFIYSILVTGFENSDEVVPSIIHLVGYQDQMNVAEATQELTAGEYHFVISNKSEQSMRFQVQDISSNEYLDTFTLIPNESRITYIKTGDLGARIQNSKALATWQAFHSF